MGELGVGTAVGADGGRAVPAGTAAVRRRRRGLVLTAAGLPLVVAALLAVLSAVQRALPTTYGWVLLGLAVLLGVVQLWPLRTAEGRLTAALAALAVRASRRRGAAARRWLADPLPSGASASPSGSRRA